MDDVTEVQLVKKLIVNINQFFFIIGGYVMIVGWWFTLPTTIAIGAYIMSACVIFGVVVGVVLPILANLYSFIKGKLTNE
jgi:hypothetical protein|tara:strand:- start:57 stop:296 length:240 start_codon:yes stop_codon:yes gene_type:complete